MARKVTMVTGGQRSGKSAVAERVAMEAAESCLYIATAEVRDEEMAERVRRHQARRGPRWTTYEEPLWIANAPIMPGQAVLVDCLTLFATNHFFNCHEDVDKALAECKQEVDKLLAQDAYFVLVTNEIGMGGISANQMQRRFTDLMGWLNQYVAQRADEVILMVSGIEVKIKNEK